jgi:hypothetical protein
MLRAGLFEKFKSRTALLLSGNAAEIRNLADTLHELGNGKTTEVNLGKVLIEKTRYRLDLIVKAVDIVRPRLFIGPGFLEWNQSADEWADAAIRATAVAESSSPCHNYIVDDGTSSVIASQGEYDDDWWQALRRR